MLETLLFDNPKSTTDSNQPVILRVNNNSTIISERLVRPSSLHCPCVYSRQYQN